MGVLGRKHTLESRRKMGVKASLAWQRPEYRERITRDKIGRTYSQEMRDKLRNANLGKTLSAEHREKIRRTLLGRQFSPETRRKIGQKSRGRKHPPRSLESIERHRQARLLRRLPMKNTSIEILLQEEFNNRQFRFEMHKSMFGRYQPDFTFPDSRLIVQADGDYWHNRPKDVERDNHFDSIAKKNGWSVLRFWEHDINQNLVQCVDKVSQFLQMHEEDAVAREVDRRSRRPSHR